MDISHKNVNGFFEGLPLIAYSCVQNGIDRKFEFVSSYIHPLLGLTPEQLLRDPEVFFQRIHSDDRNLVLKAWGTRRPLPAGICIDYRMVGEGNRIVWVHENGLMSKGKGGKERICHGVLSEASHYQDVKEELHRWDKELHSLTNNLPDVVARINQKYRLMYLNRWWDGSVMVPPEEYLGKRIVELGLPTKVADLFKKKVKTVCETEIPETIEISLPASVGVKLFEARFFPEPKVDNKDATVLLVCRDVTDVRAAEKAFKESDETFRQLAQTVDTVFWIWDVALQRMIYVSPAYERLWGGDPQKLMHNHFNWLSVVSPEDRGRVENLFLDRMDGKNFDIEYRIVTNNQEIRWVHDRTFPMKDPSGVVYKVIGIVQDVTERKKWEEERLQGAKLESLGLLAGGLAHDFNNLLTAILGQLSLAKYNLNSSHPLFSRISEAEQASVRAQEIARQLLTFSKGGDPLKKVVTLGKVLEENVRLVLSGSNVLPVFRITAQLWPVNVDLGQICQVIHNLVLNARQAMETGGECIIQAENISREEVELSRVGHFASQHDHWVRISFIDTGIGIAKEHVEKIFDPYFTTKSTGSGLGLATSYSIIRNHGGVFSVESEIGKGSTFSFILPAIPHEEMTPELVDGNIEIGQGRILIMDDEIQIRKVLGDMLEACGYSFQTAKDGEEALEIFTQAQEARNPFSAIILDLTVPGGMGGKEAIERLIKIDPDVRGIVVSGYSNDPVLANYKEYGFKGRVAKPFNLKELSTVLNSVLLDEPSKKT